MSSPEDTRFMFLPGNDSLRSAEYFNSLDNLEYDVVGPYIAQYAHREYLNNPVFEEYLQMPKSIVDDEGAQRLITLGDQLATESMPRFLDAAGWAYAEAGLALSKGTAEHRVQLIKEAERSWHKAIVNELYIGKQHSEIPMQGDDEPHRLALNLAFAPLMKSIVVGNVAKSVLKTTLLDVVAIAADSSKHLDEAVERGDAIARGEHLGFLFEVNALMALLYMSDSRYVPLPSTARADTGYYHPAQTHDISIINQHWGEIRKVIPLEIKAHSSRRDRERYKSLIIRGKMHLSFNDHNPRTTVEVFNKVIKGTASSKETESIEAMALKLRSMLKLYQQGTTPEGLAIDSLTRFHDTNKLVEQFPESSKTPRT
jgi:hypothetical protein